MFIMAKRGFSLVYNKKKKRANGVDPDEMANFEPSHQDLHCLIG